MMKKTFEDLILVVYVSKFSQGLDEINKWLSEYHISIEYIENRTGEYFIFMDKKDLKHVKSKYFKCFKHFKQFIEDRIEERTD